MLNLLRRSKKKRKGGIYQLSEFTIRKNPAKYVWCLIRLHSGMVFLLNDVLLQGPDLNNSLLGVLMRFRTGPIGVLADIEQMFHCFVVREDCRDVLRFLWYHDNLPGNEVVEYRMRVHIFGNSPSPAIAIYGLRRAAKELERDNSSHTTQLVESHFYMDDALLSFTSETEATETVEQLQEMLAISNLRLHKIASNCVNVINHFPAEDRAKDIKDLDLFADDLPVQRSLGVIWNIMTDTFTFKIPEHTKPFTRRGVLSTVNSLFDPLGLSSADHNQGRMILRDITSDNVEWDAPLPQSKFEEWRRWQESLSASKTCPQPELTIPRLELCAAVLAVEVAETVMQEIHLKWIRNRVQRIRQSPSLSVEICAHRT
ncbi:hypothetical protein WMY93_017676 [Mugilogobius chulae]|uniref:Reverse transcriptase domain-containing protein n=1 Tax=Mugilogobius chulae TaxID=88201 RepID=A0AAW0NTB1_9GOBI